MPVRKASSPAGDGERPDLELIRNLAEILTETGLTEVEFEHKGTRVRVARTIVTNALVTAPAHTMPATTVSPGTGPAPVAIPLSDAQVHPGAVTSPMVGTAYLAPAPGSPQFIEEGVEVKQGQTLLIIEAMKTMNQISAPRAGRVSRIFVTNGQPVEYGEALLVIE